MNTLCEIHGQYNYDSTLEIMREMYSKVLEKLQQESESIGYIYNFTCP